MTGLRRQWRIRLTAAAETDYRDILVWTLSRFGERQAKTYADTLAIAIKELAAGPGVLGSKQRNDIAPGVCTLHVARKRRKGRHFIVYRIAASAGENDGIEVLRILHEAMDLPRHWPPSEGVK